MSIDIQSLNPFGEGSILQHSIFAGEGSTLQQGYYAGARIGGDIIKAGEGIGKTVSGEYAREEKEAREKSARAQRRAQEIEARRAVIAQQREARIRKAQILAASTTVGAGTSGVAGATGSISSQAASNIGNIGIQQNLAQIASQENQNAANAASNAALGMAQLNFATTIFSATGGFKTTPKPSPISGAG